jgi:hypothetical protein
MPSVLCWYIECFPLISGLQTFVCSSIVFTHMSLQGPGLPRCNQGGKGSALDYSSC